ncbi:MAG: metalloregulator ArsR/SmtB family transcription factor [Bauldia sp.]
MTNRQPDLDRVFHALADPTRRAILARLGEGPATVSELARPFAMALPTFLEHVRVLERCRLLRSQKVGRVRTCRMAEAAVAAAEAWLAERRAAFSAQLDRMDAFVLDLATQEKQRERRPRNK